MADNTIKVQTQTNVKGPDFNTENLDLFKSAQTAVMAGLAATAKKYSAIDKGCAPVNREKGTFSYDTGDKSVYYHS